MVAPRRRRRNDRYRGTDRAGIQGRVEEREEGSETVLAWVCCGPVDSAPGTRLQATSICSIPFIPSLSLAGDASVALFRFTTTFFSAAAYVYSRRILPSIFIFFLLGYGRVLYVIEVVFTQPETIFFGSHRKLVWNRYSYDYLL